MKFVSYYRDDQDQLGLVIDDFVYDLDELHPELPGIMNDIKTLRLADRPQRKAAR